MSDLVIVKTPLRERVNVRLIVFAAIVLLIVGYPTYVYLEEEITQGIRDAGGGYKDVNLKAMSSFEFDQVYGKLEDIPARWRELNGQKVLLTGEIAPSGFASSGVDQFDLCYSVSKCCVGTKPLVQHFVQARMKNGDEVPYGGGLIKVWGTLTVDVKREEGQVVSIYQLDVEKVEPVM